MEVDIKRLLTLFVLLDDEILGMEKYGEVFGLSKDRRVTTSSYNVSTAR
jgi:hypothetical protein